jgi:hypothetical protein
MRNLFLGPWMSPRCRTLLSVALAAILVFSVAAVLKTGSRGNDAATEQLLTGSIQTSRTVLPKAPSDDRIAAILAPLSAPQSAERPVENLVRAPVPLPRSRPNRQ